EDSNLKNGNIKNEKSPAEKEPDDSFDVSSRGGTTRDLSAVEKPSIQKVLAYFREHDFPELQANKFYNYFQSIGWLVGGKSPMVDWRAAAQNWMINSSKFSSETSFPDRTRNLTVQTDNDYSEPL